MISWRKLIMLSSNQVTKSDACTALSLYNITKKWLTVQYSGRPRNFTPVQRELLMPWAPKLVISLAGRVLFHVASVSNYGVFYTGQVIVSFMSGYLWAFILMTKSLLKRGRVDLDSEIDRFLWSTISLSTVVILSGNNVFFLIWKRIGC